MNLTLYREAKIKLSGEVDITDPGYDKDVWCRTTINVVSGSYWARAFWNNKTRRILMLEIMHESLETPPACKNIGAIGVDSGLAGFFKNKPDYDNKEWLAICNKLATLTNNWSSPTYCVSSYNSPERCVGIYVSSGYGDGVYKIQCHKNKNDLVDYAKITF